MTRIGAMYYTCSMFNQKAKGHKIMTKQDVLSRVTLKSTKNDVKQVAKVVTIDPNQPASARQTYALYNANRAASKINGCKVFNDWHKQGLTHGECLALIAEYNKVTGYVYAPKKAAKTVKGETKPSEVTNENLGKGSKSKAKAVSQKKASETPPPNRLINHELVKAQIQALKEMKAEGLLTVAELTEALKGLQY